MPVNVYIRFLLNQKLGGREYRKRRRTTRETKQKAFPPPSPQSLIARYSQIPPAAAAAASWPQNAGTRPQNAETSRQEVHPTPVVRPLGWLVTDRFPGSIQSVGGCYL